jgi:predicted nucleic acid-binding Zn ribbon protein
MENHHHCLNCGGMISPEKNCCDECAELFELPSTNFVMLPFQLTALHISMVALTNAVGKKDAETIQRLLHVFALATANPKIIKLADNHLAKTTSILDQLKLNGNIDPQENLVFINKRERMLESRNNDLFEKLMLACHKEHIIRKP